MKNKKITAASLVLLSAFIWVPFTGFAQMMMSAAFNAVNGVTAPIVTVSQQDQVSAPFAGSPVTGVAELLYPHFLYLNYAVPVFVYKDWRYLQARASWTMANGYSYSYNLSLQNSYEYLAFTGFNSYSEHKGTAQKLEIRRGIRTPYKYSGVYPPVIPNTNPAFKIISFSAQ